MAFLEHKIPPPIVALILMICMWSVSAIGPQFQLPTLIGRALIIGITVLGIAIPVSGTIAFRKARTTVNPLKPEQATSLVKSGVFQFSRNPMYLGMSLVLVAWAISLSSLFALCLAPIFVLYITRFQIQPEERALAEVFGEEFDAYRKSVRRWF